MITYVDFALNKMLFGSGSSGPIQGFDIFSAQNNAFKVALCKYILLKKSGLEKGLPIQENCSADAYLRIKLLFRLIFAEKLFDDKFC